ncbi:PP2C family protein-serine/threonine phosphatase [Nakamurella panacisegetis]
MQVAWGAATDSGRRRPVNEDALLAAMPIFLVADGMGGHAAGGTASAIVVEEFTAPSGANSVTPEWVMDAFERSQARIRRSSAGGTTVAGVAAVQQNGTPYWLVFNIGDSRIYHCIDGVVTQISVDHSVVQELVDLGEVTLDRARFHPQRHVITRAVGAPDGPRADFWLLPGEPGDRLMICSDGITSEIDAAAIATLTRSVDTDPQQVAESLVELALQAGGRDNITVVVVDVIDVTADAPAPIGDRSMTASADRDHTLPRLPAISRVGDST